MRSASNYRVRKLCIELEKGTLEAVFFYRGDLLVSGRHSNDNNSFDVPSTAAEPTKVIK